MYLIHEDDQSHCFLNTGALASFSRHFSLSLITVTTIQVHKPSISWLLINANWLDFCLSFSFPWLYISLTFSQWVLAGYYNRQKLMTSEATARWSSFLDLFLCFIKVFFWTGFIQVLHDLHSIWKFFILYFRENRYKNLWKINLKVTFYNLLYIKTFLNYGLIFFYFTDILIKTLVKYHFMETFKIRLSTVILPYYKWRFFKALWENKLLDFYKCFQKIMDIRENNTKNSHKTLILSLHTIKYKHAIKLLVTKGNTQIQLLKYEIFSISAFSILKNPESKKKRVYGFMMVKIKFRRRNWALYLINVHFKHMLKSYN